MDPFQLGAHFLRFLRYWDMVGSEEILAIGGTLKIKYCLEG